jgi:hypothetical protein
MARIRKDIDEPRKKFPFWPRLVVSVFLFYMILWLPPMSIDSKKMGKLGSDSENSVSSEQNNVTKKNNISTSLDVYYMDINKYIPNESLKKALDAYQKYINNYNYKTDKDARFTVSAEYYKITEQQIHDDFQKIALEEHKKAIEEINLKQQHGQESYQWKFFVVGAVFWGALKYIKIHRPARSESEPEDIDKFLSTDAMVVFMSLALILSMIIDIYERDNIIVTNQIGLWIAYYIEPALYHVNHINFNENVGPLKYYGWENFIRLKGCLHNDTLNSILLFSGLHLFTVLLYGVYAIAFRGLTEKAEKAEVKHSRLICYSAVSVYLTIGFVGISGHSLPDNFVFLIFEKPYSSIEIIFYAAVLWAILFLVNLPEIISYRSIKKTEE